jgi:enoyl-CoA hydratase/carnithine racemase
VEKLVAAAKASEGTMSALTEFDDVTVEARGRVAIVRLNDPKTLNAISPRMMGGLLAALAHVENTPGFHCAILMGTGRGFCSGANLTTTGPDDILKQGISATCCARAIIRCCSACAIFACR